MKPLVIVPAAGFGRRVGSPEAKEMMWRSDGVRLIDGPLQAARERRWPVHVITRTEKQSLIDYLRQQNPLPVIQEVQPTSDWPETLLLSRPYWREWNLVYLPDMEFSPTSALDDMFALMTTAPCDVVVAEHDVADARSWGILRPLDESFLEVVEKPALRGAGRAWGLYAFRAEVGEKLLEAQLKSTHDHQIYKLNLRGVSVHLHSFRDLTRPNTD